MNPALLVSCKVALSLVAALALTLGMTLWFPAGAGGVDHLIVPMILFPLFSTVLFLLAHAVLAPLWGWALLLGTCLSHSLWLYFH